MQDTLAEEPAPALAWHGLTADVDSLAAVAVYSIHEISAGHVSHTHTGL